MPHVNLLPWRETIKKERQIRFGIATGVFLLLTAAALLGVRMYIDGLIEYQKQRNNYLTAEIKKVEEQIKEIETLEKKKQRLVDRMNVIQGLDESRPQLVHLFDELVKQVPEGVYFSKMQQKGDKVTLWGIAQSDARVSSLMRNVEKSEWIKNPDIVIIQTEEKKGTDKASKMKQTVSAFQLQVTQTTPKPEKEEGEK